MSIPIALFSLKRAAILQEQKIPMRPLAYALMVGLAASAAVAQNSTSAPLPTLSATEAAQHVGEDRTVCGQIANEYTATATHGTPTFVDIDQAYPHQIFDLVIWGDNKDDVGSFPKTGKICASGKIILFKGRPEILLPDWHAWYVPQS